MSVSAFVLAAGVALLPLAPQEAAGGPSFATRGLVGVGSFVNLRHGYVGLHLAGATRRFLLERRLRFGGRYDGFRIGMAKTVIIEVNRLALEADYLMLSAHRWALDWALAMHAGAYLFVDITRMKDRAGGGFNASPLLGSTLALGCGAHRASLRATLSGYDDGGWLELDLAYGYAVLSWLRPTLSLRMVNALTWNGRGSVGFYPLFSLEVPL